MKCTVTIGVCVRNCEDYVKTALDSISEQDFPHELMEVILVDDGSEDNTLDVIGGYISDMDMRTKIFHHEWQGLGPSRNIVVDNASGDYIIWVDGDMILPMDHVRKQVEFMDRNPKIGIAKARYGFLNEGSLVGFLEDIGYVAVDHMFGGKTTYRPLGTGGSIYRVAAIRQIKGFDASIKGAGEDMDAECRIRRSGWFLFLGTSAVFYERRRKSLRALWDEGFWHGYVADIALRKNGKPFVILEMTPMAGLLAGAWYSAYAYRIVHKKIVFLLPLQYSFKRIAWCFGFIKGQIDRL